MYRPIVELSTVVVEVETKVTYASLTQVNVYNV